MLCTNARRVSPFFPIPIGNCWLAHWGYDASHEYPIRPVIIPDKMSSQPSLGSSTQWWIIFLLVRFCNCQLSTLVAFDEEHIRVGTFCMQINIPYLLHNSCVIMALASCLTQQSNTHAFLAQLRPKILCCLIIQLIPLRTLGTDIKGFFTAWRIKRLIP